MSKKLPYLHSFKDRHGKRRDYYRRSGSRQAIKGEFGSAEWLKSYASIHQSFEAQGPAVADHNSFEFAVQEYLASRRFQKLADTTKQVYRIHLDKLRESLGHVALSDFTRGSVVQIRNRIAAKSPRSAIEAIKLMNLVFECACDLDMIDRNPAKGVKKPDDYKAVPHRPWTEDEIALFAERADPFMRRAMMFLLYTGLRCSDALDLTRACIEENMISTTAGKTGTDLFIPLHVDLRAELARSLPIESIYLVPGRRGQQLTRFALINAVKRQFWKLGIQSTLPLHGLRKNAIICLIEAGCTPRQIQPITGQSLQMIEHYGQGYDRRRLASEAIIKWEESGRGDR